MGKTKIILSMIRRENIFNKLKIVINIILYVGLKIILNIKTTEALLLKKVPLPTTVKWFKIVYYYELLTFLNNFETDEYLKVILDEKYWTIIDIWSNIWRLSWIAMIYNKNKDISFILCDPNPYVFKMAKGFYERNIKAKNKIYFLNKAVSDARIELPFYILKWKEASWLWSIHSENLSNMQTKKITVESITFDDIAEKISSLTNNLLIKIDVEWHEEHVLRSILKFISAKDSKIRNIDLLIEIWDNNVDYIHHLLKESWYLKTFKKISYNDYLVILEK